MASVTIRRKDVSGESSEVETSSVQQESLGAIDAQISKEILQPSDGKRVSMPERRFCEKCQMMMPYRTRHCKDCGRCVRKFDHHCFWLGGCVGELNHRKFWLMLVF